MRLANLTWPQAEKVLAQDPVVIFPIGTAEQHGRHLPLGTDMIAPEYIADRIEAMNQMYLSCRPGATVNVIVRRNFRAQFHWGRSCSMRLYTRCFQA